MTEKLLTGTLSLNTNTNKTFVIPSFYFSDCGQKVLMCLGQIPLNFHGKNVEGVSGVEINQENLVRINLFLYRP